MSNLTHIEKQKLERELGMSSGYVLGFSNRTYEEFFREVVGIGIYETRFDYGSGSKANRMRAFWNIATDDQLCLLFNGLLEGWDIYSGESIPQSARELLIHLLKRLGGIDTPEVKQENKSTILSEDVSRKLNDQLIQVSSLTPQKRGYNFESSLDELFNAYGLAARASIRLTGEQIDGSFEMHNETYLLEAKWQSAKTGAADLHTFEGKLRQKASWSRGLFVSHSGFSTDGLHAFGRGKRLICMDGFDIYEMLRLKLSFIDVIDAKVRRAAETGCPFVPIRDLFMG
jgi:hypothetical protein